MIKKKYKLLLLLLAAALLTPAMGQNKDSHKFRLAKQVSVLNDIIKDLNMFYVDSIMPDKFINKSIDAMLRNLDPYTVYYPEEKSNELKMMTTGKYAGVGSVITYHAKKKSTVISEPYVGMPAHKAGLKAGDVILSVNDVNVKGMSSDSVSDLMRGEAGTKVTIVVERPGTKKPLTFKMVRENIALPAINYYGIEEGDVGYISLTSFTQNCAKDMRKAVVELKKQGATSFMIDLRDNGGGLLDEAIDIVGLFVPKRTTVVTTKGKTEQSNEVYATKREPIDTESPIVVLVNGQTASASEILAGALQDFDRAVVVGSRTFGKGLVQSTRQVSGGGYLKLTTAKYYIPSGRCVQALDYSHMIDDGKSTRVPDSLTNIFHTAAGREVRDGGGIRPDIEPKPEEASALAFRLVHSFELFDFVTEFCLKHSSIEPAETFTVSDELYEEFKEYLKKTGFSYDMLSVKILAELKEMVKLEGFEETTKEEIESIEKKLQSSIDKPFSHFSKYLKTILANEIVKRYHGQRGECIYLLRDDNDIKEGISILKESKRYKEILTPKKQAHGINRETVL